MPPIELPFSHRRTFESNDLLTYIKTTGLNYIIQGQTACSLADHPKPLSLDYWLRVNFASQPNTMQAVNEVIQQLIATGDFVEGKFDCPKSGRKCKGIKIVE